MTNLKIYLAGKMSGLSFEQMNTWRTHLKEELKLIANDSNYNLIVINPVDYYNFTENRQQSEIENFDLAHVITSNIVIANLDGLKSSDGTKIELYEANYNHRIPVIVFGNKKLYKELHPWIKNSITRVENNMQDVISYIRDFYMN